MAGYVRILIIVALAVFAGQTILSAASATGMDMKMTAGADMGDCEGCPGGDVGTVLCDSFCVPSVFAVVPANQPMLPGAETVIAGVVVLSVAGRAAPPDPYPPRTNILS